MSLGSTSIHRPCHRAERRREEPDPDAEPGPARSTHEEGSRRNDLLGLSGPPVMREPGGFEALGNSGPGLGLVSS